MAARGWAGPTEADDDEDRECAVPLLTAELLPKQLEFLNLDKRWQLFSGAFGAGKTRALCYKLVERARLKGSREGLCRKRLIDLKTTTMRTLLEPEGDLPPVLPPGTYVHNRALRTIKLIGGGEIYYFGLDDPDKKGSTNLSGCAMDEALEFTEADLVMIDGRVRLKKEGLTRQIYMACNPGSPMHHLAKRFGLAGSFVCDDDAQVVRTKSRDNHYLPEDYLASLDKLEGTAGRRFRDGEWVGGEGLVYPNFDIDRNILHQPAGKRWFVVVDDGFTNPFAVLHIGVDGDGRMHIEEEVYERELSVAEKVGWVKALGGMMSEWVIVDPSAAQLINELRKAGFDVLPANNDVQSGLNRVRSRLKPAGDARARLTVEPTCEMVLMEFGTYENKPDKATGGYRDEPKKVNDHTMDGIRYLANYLAMEEEQGETEVYYV